MSGTVCYRVATPEDSDGILEIYRPYIEDTTVTFEETVPSSEAFRARVEGILAQYPYLVAEWEGQIVGYAYASPYRPREGFRWTAELSVYVQKDLRNNGIGTRLYGALLDLLRIQGYANAVSVVSHPNEGSERLHARFAFRRVGIQRHCGFKNGAWCDVALFERCLGDYPLSPRDPIPFSQLPRDRVEGILNF